MPFNSLLEKVFTEAFDSEKYKKLKSRTFFDFDKSAYKLDREEPHLIYQRTYSSGDNTLDKVVKAEVKFGWMCGMDRDRIVQRPTNYSEIMRNNCILKRDVNVRLHEAYNDISGV
jgi:hypothetical protein